MENFKEIVYRDSDSALMIIPVNENLEIIPRFVNELPIDDKTPLDDLRTFCLTKVTELAYVVYKIDNNRLDIQPVEGEVVYLLVSEMDINDKEIVENAGIVCTKLLNN